MTSLIQMEQMENWLAARGFKRTRSCCGIPTKFCTSDEWQGNILKVVQPLQRRIDELERKLNDRRQ